ncbi:hypothetical protein GO496_24935 [Acidovorax citrulli]|nr:hypothetical protein [Paracidovorax citrulli]
MLTRTKPMSRGTVGLKRSRFASASRGLPAAEPDRAERLAARARAAMESAAFTLQLKALQARRPAFAPAVVHALVDPQAVPTTIPEGGAAAQRAPTGASSLRCPCKACGRHGHSQHAHENQGKGMGLKVDDRRGFPLCTVAPGRVGCHELFDQYQLVEGGREAHRLLGERWAAETRREIEQAGLWPVKLKPWKGTNMEMDKPKTEAPQGKPPDQHPAGVRCRARSSGAGPAGLARHGGLADRPEARHRGRPAARAGGRRQAETPHPGLLRAGRDVPAAARHLLRHLARRHGEAGDRRAGAGPVAHRGPHGGARAWEASRKTPASSRTAGSIFSWPPSWLRAWESWNGH